MQILLFIACLLAISFVGADEQALRRHRRREFNVNDEQKMVDTNFMEDEAFFIRVLGTSFSHSLCSSDCPCCNPSKWPEFVAAVDAYSGDDDKCFTRNDATSFILALNDCESGDTAYMSYDYENYGGTKEDPVYYCGTSSSDRNLLTKSQIMACEDTLRKKLKKEDGECGSSLC